MTSSPAPLPWWRRLLSPPPAPAPSASGAAIEPVLLWPAVARVPGLARRLATELHRA